MIIPGQHVQRGQPGDGGAVALVVVGHRLAPALDHRQRWLGAVERLHGGLLIGAQHDRLLRRIQIKPDDIDQLLLELRIVGQLERLDPVRFEAPRRPHLLHSRFRHPRWRAAIVPASSNGFRPADPSSGSDPRSRRSSPAGSSSSDQDRTDLRELDQPSTRSSANRARHPLTDPGDTDTARAIAVFARPSAAINNARARTTSRCGANGDRATDSRTSRCPGDTSRAGTGRHMLRDR